MKLINNETSEIDPIALYHLHMELLKSDEIKLAHRAAIEALEFKKLDIKKRIDLLWFFVRYDDGIKYIVSHCNHFINHANTREKNELKKFLLKLIELGYLYKLDLSSQLISQLFINI